MEKEQQFTQEQVKGIVQFIFSGFVTDLKQVQDVDGKYRDYETIDDLIQAYSGWTAEEIEVYIKSSCVNRALIL